MFCINCGKEIQAGAKFCTECGHCVNDTKINKKKSSKLSKIVIGVVVLFVLLGAMIVGTKLLGDKVDTLASFSVVTAQA